MVRGAEGNDTRLGQLLSASRPHLIFLNGAADENDDALPLVLVLAMLERQLRNLNGRAQVNVALDLHLLHGVQYLAQIGSGSDQHLGRAPGHAHHPHRVLRVVLRLSPGQQIHSIRLSLKPCWCIVAIASKLAIVNAHDGRLLQRRDRKRSVTRARLAQHASPQNKNMHTP